MGGVDERLVIKFNFQRGERRERREGGREREREKEERERVAQVWAQGSRWLKLVWSSRRSTSALALPPSRARGPFLSEEWL